jgi:hypothetical protein
LRLDVLIIDDLLADAEGRARLQGEEFQFCARHPHCWQKMIGAPTAVADMKV